MSLEVHIEKKLNGFTLRSDFTAGNTATAILGASGCGKSMTLRCIAGIVKPDKGRIVLDGRVLFDSGQHIDLPPQQRGVGLLFQNYALFPNMTVEQNILCGLKAEKDKAARKGIRIQDLFDEKIFRLKVETALKQKNPVLSKIYGLHTYTVEEICEEYLPYARILKPYMAETAHMLNSALREGKSVLFEGAQGTLLDIDHGTYPFVTSSSCCAGGAATGSGVGPTAIDRVLGIQKAYITRVGAGPFPTELVYPENGGEGQDAIDGDLLCAEGHEYGVTTGRKRRCGWFDAVIARYAAEVNGLTDIALTKLDVLSAFDELKICVAYECDGETYDYFPMQQSVLFHAKPVYKTMPGWKGEDITKAKSFEDLPANAQAYIEELERLSGVKATIISVGPDRDQTFTRGW